MEVYAMENTMENNTQLSEQQQFQQEQKKFNEEQNGKRQWEEPDLQKVEKLEVLDI